MQGVVEELVAALGRDKVLTSREDLIPYQRDAAFTGEIPLAVVLPSSADDVSRALRVCNERGTPVYVRGGGTSLTGASAPLGGVVISMRRMNRILEFSPVDRYVVAEAGVRLDDLNGYLLERGYMYPPDPASSSAATVGGSIATNAGGLRGVAYGSTKNWVLGLEVVLADGRVTFFGGRTLKRSAGYDLASLMVGSEGTLGVITKAVLRVTRAPEATVRIVAYYTSEEALGEALRALMLSGANVTMAEFMDRGSMESVRRAMGLQYPEGAEYMLMVDVSGGAEEVKRMAEAAVQGLSAASPVSVRATQDRDEMEALYMARKGLYSSTLAQRSSPREGVIIGDVVVPPSEVPPALKEIRALIRSSGASAVVFGHIGDGNIHMNVFADMQDEGSRRRAFELLREVGLVALRHGGSVSAEHGIGLEKRELLIEELRATGAMPSYELMKSIKEAFDPRHILNRGKLLDL